MSEELFDFSQDPTDVVVITDEVGAQESRVIADSSSDDENVPTSPKKPAVTNYTPLKRLYLLDSPDKQESKRPRLLESFKLKIRNPNAASAQNKPKITKPKYVFDDDDDLFDDQDDDGDEDTLLSQCENISNNLRKVLGKLQLEVEDDRFGAVRLDSSEHMPTLVTKTELGVPGQRLKNYQLVGINFMMLLYQQKIGGAILADEMGLGKTAQAITFFNSLLQKGNMGPHLVVCPPSLLENWQRELQQWGPDLVVLSYYGSKRDRIRDVISSYRNRIKHSGQQPHGVSGDALLGQYSDNEESNSDDSEQDGYLDEFDESVYVNHAGVPIHFDENNLNPPFNVLLTCYTLFEKNSGEAGYDRKFLYGWDYSVVLLDEAHAVKNKTTQRSQRLVKLVRKSQMRLLLTGTPLQNDLLELSNLLEYLEPNLFNEEAKEKLVRAMEDPLKRGGLIQRMRSLLAPFVLRRLKSEVAVQLANKTQKVVKLQMLDSQKQVYEQAIQRVRKELGNNGLKKLGVSKVKNIFVQLRKISQHPLLIRSGDWFDDQAVQDLAITAQSAQYFGPYCNLDRVLQELEQYSDFGLHELSRHLGGKMAQKYCLPDKAIYSSAKFSHLKDLLLGLQAEGHRPLIFSQWTSILDLLEWLLQLLNLPYLRLDGSTPVQDRLSRVDCFNDVDSQVFAFLVSTRAGGQGLNLIGADTVIIHDVDFNPQVDRQAEDRCHRLGQTKPVTVYRLIVQDTVDEKIQNLAESKLQLDEAVLGEHEKSSEREISSKKSLESRLMSDILADLIAQRE